MTHCVDCGDPSFGSIRCSECAEEVLETPNWAGEPVYGPPEGPEWPPGLSAASDRMRRYLCEACGRLCVVVVKRGRPYSFCTESECMRARARASYKTPLAPYGSKAALCAGCGKTIWRSSTSKPHGEQRCLDCRRSAPDPKCTSCGGSVWQGTQICRPCRSAIALARGFSVCCRDGCARTVYVGDLCRPHWEQDHLDVNKVRARWRNRNHQRRTVYRDGDVTPAFELELRKKATRCPMLGCGVKLVDEPYQPASKELDHIVPLCVGGTHTIGNVRIICRLCNQSRPDDGSDYTGPVTLWAEAV